MAAAAGAVVAAAAWMSMAPAATASVISASNPTTLPTLAGSPSVLAVGKAPDLSAIAGLEKGRQMQAERAAREAAARRPLTVAPTSGIVTSGFGARWGSTHDGVDIANTIGTPVLAVTDGVVLQSGVASGFGLWVRVRQDDGTIGIYGHINEFFVSAGQKVLAGQEIATMGNRGISTGPHLHYSVQLAAGEGVGVDPAAWLQRRGITLT